MTNITALAVGGVLSGLGMLGVEVVPDGGLVSILVSSGAGGGIAFLLLRNQFQQNKDREIRLGKIEDERVALAREVIAATTSTTTAMNNIAVLVERSTHSQEQTCHKVDQLVEALRTRPCIASQHPYPPQHNQQTL